MNKESDSYLKSLQNNNIKPLTMVGEIISIFNSKSGHKNTRQYNNLKKIILNNHYAHRLPSISYAYGLVLGSELIGCLTIGKPASNSLCIGVCGKKYSSMVYELNRFWLKDGLPKNTASFFMSACLRDLDNIILVSYADSGMNHTGYIYQASNWIYTGKTKQRTDKYVPSGKHSRHYNNEYDYLRKVRTSKYRYVFFAIHNKRLKTQLKTQLNYTIEPYQKQENRKYKIGDTKKEQILNTITGNVFFE